MLMFLCFESRAANVLDEPRSNAVKAETQEACLYRWPESGITNP